MSIEKRALCAVDFFEELSRNDMYSGKGLCVTSLKFVKNKEEIITLPELLASVLFTSLKYKLVNRSICENVSDGSLLQIIPYIVIRDGGYFMTYDRGHMSGEKRLLGSSSIGFGGHVDIDFPENANCVFSKNNHLLQEAERELEEELGVTDLRLSEHFDKLPVYLITANPNDDLTDSVAKAHLGYLIDVDLSVVKIPALELAFKNAFSPEGSSSNEKDAVSNLRIVEQKSAFDHIDRFERWSQAALRVLQSDKEKDKPCQISERT